MNPLKPYYDDGTVTIYHGDCREVIGWLQGQRTFITDPPYGMGHYATDRLALTAESMRTMIDCGTTAIFGYPEQLVRWCVEAQASPDEWVTWWATNKAGRSAGLMRESECVAVFGPMPGSERVMQPRTGTDPVTAGIVRGRGLDPMLRRAGDVWSEASPGMGFNSHARHHPNEKPLGVMRRLVDLCSELGGLVVDPFCGSGTTLRAAKDLGRYAVGVEIEERYCEIAAKRCAQEVLDLAA